VGGSKKTIGIQKNKTGDQKIKIGIKKTFRHNAARNAAIPSGFGIKK